MRQSLQNKVNLLGSLFVAFFLLMLPMCTQVRADTKDSMKQASDTWLVQQIRKLTKSDGTPTDLGDPDVEDVWRKRVHEQNPDCGPECDPDADYDGDGISNYDEHQQGRNPWCNEEKDSTCKDKDPEKPVDPPQPPTPRNKTKDLLLDHTFAANNDCPDPPQGVLTDVDCNQRPFPRFTIAVGRDYDVLDFYVNATGYEGQRWHMDYSNATSDVIIFSDNSAALPQSPRNYPPAVDPTFTLQKPGAADYEIQLTGRITDGNFQVQAYGIVR